jgi:hypothetical protein
LIVLVHEPCPVEKLVKLTANDTHLFALDKQMKLVVFDERLRELSQAEGSEAVYMPQSSNHMDVDDLGNVFVMYYVCEKGSGTAGQFVMSYRVRVFSTLDWKVTGPDLDVETSNQFKVVDSDTLRLFSGRGKSVRTMKRADDGKWQLCDDMSGFAGIKGEVLMLKDRMCPAVALLNRSSAVLYFN